VYVCVGGGGAEVERRIGSPAAESPSREYPSVSSTAAAAEEAAVAAAAVAAVAPAAISSSHITHWPRTWPEPHAARRGAVQPPRRAPNLWGFCALTPMRPMHPSHAPLPALPV
jgi:hypothetical protein